jgi:hypothetical protein
MTMRLTELRVTTVEGVPSGFATRPGVDGRQDDSDGRGDKVPRELDREAARHPPEQARVTAHIYLHADMTQKERAIARVTPPGTTPGCYRPPDTLLAFLDAGAPRSTPGCRGRRPAAPTVATARQ